MVVRCGAAAMTGENAVWTGDVSADDRIITRDSVFGSSSTMLCRLPFSLDMLSVPKMLRVVRRQLLPFLPLLRGPTGAAEFSLT
jgi:hypothetical protein